jgi:hypothetical protein
MPRPSDRWRDDRLGALVRVGLSGARRASPPPVVWARIVAVIDPPSPGRGVLDRLIARFNVTLAPPEVPRPDVPMWCSLPGLSEIVRPGIPIWFAVPVVPRRLGAAADVAG